MKYDIAMLGHVSRDIIIDHLGREERLLGGAVVQSRAAAARAGAKVLVVTKAATEDIASLGFMREDGSELVALPSPASTSILNRFHSADRERRDTSLVSRAEAFSAKDLPAGVEASIVDLAGLFVGELPETLIEELCGRGMIASDAQGLLRRAEPDGRMLFADWAAKKRYLPMVGYFKTDAAEAEILTGLADRETAARVMASWGAREVMVTHNSEVIVLAEGRVYRAPFTSANLSGRTGRGDTTFASYLAWRLGHSPEESVRFAAALCSIKMESPGPFHGSLAEVFERMERDARRLAR
jgi:sugar/nucleoside kinase (ribokinase family)